MTEGTKMGREGEIFQSTLDSFYSEERIFSVVILEKEFSEDHRQRVGAVFISVPADASGSDAVATVARSLIFALLLILSLCFFFLFSSYRSIVRPMQELNRAAEAFAKGDFSGRISEKGAGEITPLIRAFNQMAEKVEKNESIRQTFVSNVSHDLRTPLTTIGGFVQNMMAGAVSPEQYNRYFKIILDEVNRLSRLVQTLLETSRMTAGERKYDFCPMDLCELGRITLLSFENRLEEKELDVSFESEEDSLFVTADSDAIQQVIYNLLDNAIKFVPNQGKLAIRIFCQEKKVLFSVENSGDGIPQEELSHLFDRFYKSDRSRGLHKKGMGLGLFIVKTVIAAHGEEVWVESSVGNFTRFVFSLPQAHGKTKKTNNNQ
jgi:signal transduction histidine kinase